MPKIFITGSNLTKGFVTGSGYVSNPVRHLIREADNRPGDKPTKLRFGTRDRLGNNPVSFNDNNTVKYGRSIQDSFEFKNNTLSILKTKPNLSKWDISDGIEIRREFSPSNKEFNNGALVLAGLGDGGIRWIKTKEKVKNATLIFEVIQGPYQLQSELLNLGQGQSTDILKVQISEDGLSGWTDVLIKENNVSSSAFLNGNNHLTPIFDNSSLRIDQESSLLVRKKSPVCKVKIDMNSFKLDGKGYYIRIAQTSISDSGIDVWALRNIKIIGRDDTLEYPLLASQSQKSFELSLTGAIASPNTHSGLIATGSSIKNLTDYAVSFKSFESNINFFDDNRQISDNGESFYDEGVDSNVYPGFNRPLKSKDVIEFDLNTTNKVDVGFIRATTDGGNDEDETGQGDILMTYWNKNKSSWEKIGKDYQYGLNNRPTVEQTHSNLQAQLTSSCIGFNSSLNAIAKGSSASSLSFMPKDASVVINKPTDIFNFPYGPQYHATSSLYLKAKDLGVIKPFIVEKAEINFDIELEAPQAFSNYYRKFYEQFLSSTTGQPSRRLSVDGMYNITPTFFMLRQFRDNYTHEGKYLHGSTSQEYKYNFSIPGLYDLSPTNSSLRYVNKNRELIGFANTTFSFIFSQFTTNLTHDDFSEYYPTDNFIKIDESSKSIGASPTSFTGSNINTKFTISNFSNYSGVNFTNGQIGGNPTPVYMEKRSTNRTNNISVQRAIVNNIASLDLGGDFEVPDISYSDPLITKKLNKSETANKVSPYIIFPDDEIIFGWQYPLPLFNFGNERTTSDPGAFKMTIGNSKIKLYGSLVKDNKEFHEGLNQNLTTDAVYEAIGNDAVLDQFQLATRGELTGSILAETYTSLGSNNGNNDAAVFSNLIFPNFVLRNKPFQRIGAFAPSSLDPSWASSNDYMRGLFLKNVFNIQGTDLSRKFADCFLVSADKAQFYEGNILFSGDNGVFTSQGYGFIPSIVSPPETNSTGKYEYYSTSPQYSFNSSHFGFYSDLIQQGKDGKFIDDITTDKDDITSSSPVQIKFVDSEYIDQDLGFRRFTLIENSVMNGKTDSEYQSSNLSLYATSSIGFKDDGITRNRVYS